MVAMLKEAYETARVLAKYGADPNVSDDFDVTPLMLASSMGDIKLMEYLLKNKAQVDAVDMEEWSAVFYAMYDEQIEALNLLIKHKANLNLRDYRGESVLDYAKKFEDRAMIRLLEKYGAK